MGAKRPHRPLPALWKRLKTYNFSLQNLRLKIYLFHSIHQFWRRHFANIHTEAFDERFTVFRSSVRHQNYVFCQSQGVWRVGIWTSIIAWKQRKKILFFRAYLPKCLQKTHFLNKHVSRFLNNVHSVKEIDLLTSWQRSSTLFPRQPRELQIDLRHLLSWNCWCFACSPVSSTNCIYRHLETLKR